jgi:SAM-dependent methyltransferase
MSRNDTILAGIDRTMRILEIGPSFSPIAPKADGWNTCVVDHASTEELVEKFRGNPDTDIGRIEPVDVIWNGGPLDDAVPRVQHGTFDACIVSHVLEHITDPIAFLQSLERLLTPRGVVTLALPDKRRCFDFFKPVSTTGELLDAHARNATRHSGKALFDFLAYNVYADGDYVWERRPIGNVRFFTPLAEAKRELDQYRGRKTGGSTEYVDCHAWHFTPASFELVMLELAALGEIDFTVARTLPTVGHEFYASLRRNAVSAGDDAALEAARLRLLRQSFVELRDQADCLLGAAPTAEPSSPRSPAGAAATAWPPGTGLVRSRLARYLSGDGADLGPGSHPFPVPYPGSSMLRVDRWQPDENADLYPELVDAAFPEPDVVCDLNEERLSAVGDGKLDFVVASHVLEHVADPIGLLDDMHRVLRPDGIAVVLLPDRRLTFDRRRPPTALGVLVRKHTERVTSITDADIDEFLRLADPDGYAALQATPLEARPALYDWHRHRSIHVHCWHEEEFVEVLEHCIRELGHTWELLDGVIAEDEGPSGLEFGYVLRKSSVTLDAATRAARFAAVWRDWVADRRHLHAAVAADRDRARAELDAVRSRRIVRTADRAARLLRRLTARLPSNGRQHGQRPHQPVD